MSGSCTDPPPERSQNQPKPYLPLSSCAQVHASRDCTWGGGEETVGISIVPMSVENRPLNALSVNKTSIGTRHVEREKEEEKGCNYRQQYCADVPTSGSYGKPPPERSLYQARPDMTMHRDTAREEKKSCDYSQYCAKPPPHPLPSGDPPPERFFNQPGPNMPMHRDTAREEKGCDYRHHYRASVTLCGMGEQ